MSTTETPFTRQYALRAKYLHLGKTEYSLTSHQSRALGVTYKPEDFDKLARFMSTGKEHERNALFVLSQKDTSSVVAVTAVDASVDDIILVQRLYPSDDTATTCVMPAIVVETRVPRPAHPEHRVVARLDFGDTFLDARLSGEAQDMRLTMVANMLIMLDETRFG